VYGRWGLVMGMAWALAFGGCAKTPPAPTTTTGSTSTATGGSREQEVRTTAIVKDVDLANRLVTLRRSDGETVIIGAGQEVRNLPQLKRGDRVVAVSYDSIAFQVLKPGARKPPSRPRTTFSSRRSERSRVAAPSGRRSSSRRSPSWTAHISRRCCADPEGRS
jgi:hypothetical protein